MTSQKRFLLLANAVLVSLCLLSFSAQSQEVPFKAGDIIGPQNWERVKDMVPSNLLNRIKQGYSFQLKEPKRYQVPKEYIEATENYSKKVSLGPKGELQGHVAGLPFPNLNPNDPQAGLKLVWNFYWRWVGDDYQNGGNTDVEKVIRHAIERDGSERRADVVSYFLLPRTRVTLNPKPVIPGYEHIDKMQLRVDQYPRDSSGTTTLEIRYADPDRQDDLYIYVPTIRRIRRFPTTQRCATLAPSEVNLDDVDSGFSGKITDFNYRLLGEKKVLAVFSQEHVPYRRKTGDYLPVDEKWEIRDVYVLEIASKSPDYCYPKKILYLDKVTWETPWSMVWDKKGEYWKEFMGLFTPVRLPDGREVWSVATVAVVNVQNGRSTVIITPRKINNGFSPSIWSLATMQAAMRGGAIK